MKALHSSHRFHFTLAFFSFCLIPCVAQSAQNAESDSVFACRIGAIISAGCPVAVTRYSGAVDTGFFERLDLVALTMSLGSRAHDSVTIPQVFHLSSIREISLRGQPRIRLGAIVVGMGIGLLVGGALGGMTSAENVDGVGICDPYLGCDFGDSDNVPAGLAIGAGVGAISGVIYSFLRPPTKRISRR